MASLRTWTGQAGAAEGIARAVIDFAVQILTGDHEDVADVLRQMEALDAHPAPVGAHPVPLSIV